MRPMFRGKPLALLFILAIAIALVVAALPGEPSRQRLPDEPEILPAPSEGDAPSAPAGASRKPPLGQQADGKVRGELALAGGGTADVAIVTKDALVLARSRRGPGPFELGVPEHEEEDRPLFLLIVAPGHERAQIALPAGGGDVGVVDVAAGPTYRGWLMDEAGHPVPDVVVMLSRDRFSLPSDKDGSFVVPLKAVPRPEHVRYWRLRFSAKGAFYGPQDADPSGLGSGHRVNLGDPGLAPRMRLVRPGGKEFLARVKLSIRTSSGSVIDRGRTDDHGCWDPRWSGGKIGLLRVEDPAGGIWIPLSRDDVYAAERCDVVVSSPADSNLYSFRWIDAEGEPLSGIRCLLRARWPDRNRESFALYARPDHEGRFAIHLADPEGGTDRVRSWTTQIEFENRWIQLVGRRVPDAEAPEEIVFRISDPRTIERVRVGGR